MKQDGILGIITARGGSKRLPGKNIMLLNGKPLLAYTCEAALGSMLTRTILSTDDAAIAAVGKSCGVEVPFLRPAELARDDTPSMDVIAHVLSHLQEKEQYVPAIIVLLQPTSPLRTSAHIDAGIRLLQETGADSIVSVTEVPHAPAARNGALYIFKTESFLRSPNRYGADSRTFIMDPAESVDIDTPDDFARAQSLLQGKGRN
ncbi:MAG: acylneuraminate cytidylyltransferase family protein [Candidatus Peribacteraceae bacterium]|nr:acylneuraminate cytidylyltransferase family protein [Candidatus Peribacteraceae bacterium]